jgi:phosphoribosyl 1,2-cyclic phosphodiesterase
LTDLEIRYLFEEFIGRAEKKGATRIEDLRNLLKKVPTDPQELPITFGGRTSCYEIIHNDKSVFIDMGTGISAVPPVAGKGIHEFTVFLTHMHWDHIMGMPFFVPIYAPDTRLTIYHVHPHTPEAVAIQFNGINFPVKWDVISPRIQFKQLSLYQTLTIHGMQVTPFQLDHPGGSYGYRFNAGGKSIVIGVDSEYKRLTPDELGKDLKYYQDLDWLVFDAQYEMHELASKYDWGHSSPSIGVDLALREGIKNLVLTHHDFQSSEECEESMLCNARNYLKTQLPAYQEIWDKLGMSQGPNIIAGYDGLQIDL